jgi:type I restriction enzyme, S subunit
MSIKSKATATKEEPTPALVPKLRFQEFRGAEVWEPATLGEKSSILKGKGISKADLDPNGSQACIRYGELYTRYGETIREAVSRTKVPASELFLSKPNDVIIPSSGETKIDIAKASCVLVGGIALGGDLNIIRSKLNGTFLSYYLNGPKRLDIAKVAQGDTVVHLYPHQLDALQIAVPIPAEQQEIAECLSSADEVIAAQARKLDALKTHKKGLMQQLFPREGETQPRLRFPEFQEGGKWEVKAIGDVFKVTRGEVLAMPLVSDEPSSATPYPVYSSQTKNTGLAGFYSDYLYQDAITWTTDGANAGDVNFRRGKFYCTNVCGVLISKDGSANVCIAALLNSVTRAHVSYVGNPKLMNGVMARIEIPFPSIAEQQRISACLSTLDELIATETQKFDAIKAHKRGLMQQLFPSAEEVEA